MKPHLITLLEKELEVQFYNIAAGEYSSSSRAASYYVDEVGDLVELNLSNLNLKAIPQAFYTSSSDLRYLRILNLRSNFITDLGDFLHAIPKLAVLDIRNNEISDVRIFKGLKTEISLVSLDNNKVFDLTPFYEMLLSNQIDQLTFKNNPIAYPDRSIDDANDLVRAIGLHKSIVEAHIRTNFVKKNDLLDLGNLGITDLSWFPSLFKSTHLKTLIISNEWAEYNEEGKMWERKSSHNSGSKNNLRCIPKDISKLRGLETLIVGGDWKSKFDDHNSNWRLKDVSNIFKLKKLSFLNISNNEIEDIQDIVHLNRLRIAHINNNKIFHVPNLSNLSELREIYISNNYIENIKFLIGCFYLETVDLHSNRIDDLLPLEDLLKDSKTRISIKDSSWEKGVISVGKNSPQIVPPYEILDQGNEGFFLYLKQMRYEEILKLNKYYNKEIKIVLVGNSTSGKSTMLNYLKTKRFKEQIPVTHWLVTEELKDVNIDNDIYKLRFFDFGGQDYYHDTHKLFFSSDSVYLLLWDHESNHLHEIKDERGISQERIQVFPLEYWLDAIKIYTKKALSESQLKMELLLEEREYFIRNKKGYKRSGEISYNYGTVTNNVEEAKNTLIVQNKIDRSHGFLNQRVLTTAYPNIYEFMNLSLLKGTGKKHFEELFVEIIKKNRNYNRPLLATWGFIKDNLSDIFRDDDFIVSMKIFQERINSYLFVWLADSKNRNERQISNILFDEEDIMLFASFLKEIGLVIYSSEVHELRDFVIVDQNIFLEEVYVILRKAKENMGILPENHLSSDNRAKQVLKTLVSHKILFNDKNTSSYIAPLFLPENPDFLVALLADIKVPFRRFRFKGFIPKSIILSIFSEVIYNQDISQEDFYYWKNGLIFKDKKSLQKVFLKFSIGYEHGCAYIDVFNFRSNDNKTYIKEFTKVITKVISSEGIVVDELLTIDGVFFVELKKLIFRYENNINFITAEDFDKSQSKQISVFKYNQLLEDKMKKPSKKLFISYSKQDEKLVNNFVDHLSSLQSQGIIESWYCTELKGGDDWDLTIKEKLNEADIVCFMISPKFMATPYIHKYEVKHAFKRYEQGEELKIIPIVMDYVDWSRTYTFQSRSGEEIAWSLKRFNALPFAETEIVNFENENKAWFLVASAIRAIVENDINSENDDEDEVVRKLPPNIKKIYEDIKAGKGMK